MTQTPEQLDVNNRRQVLQESLDRSKTLLKDIKGMIDKAGIARKAKNIHFTIPGKPISKHRPRFFRRGNFVGTYNDQETEEGRWLWEAKHQLNEQGFGILKLIEGPIILRVSFVFQIPKNTPKKIMKELEDGKAMWHTKNPDTSNLIKFVEDCLNQFLWEDDRQVVYIAAMKVYGLQAETQIEIEEI